MSGDRFVRHANWMSLLTVLSRITGLVRDKVCSWLLGAGTAWSAFWIGFVFPNLFRRIFGEGALTAVFLPAYSQALQKEGREAANKLASATLTLLVLVLAGITAVGEVIAIPLARSENISPDNRLAAAMIAIMLPYCVLVCVVAFMSAIAAVHERFTEQSVSPMILNLLMAGGAGLAVWRLGARAPLEQRIYWVAWAVLAAGVVQVVQMIPPLVSAGVRLRPTMRFAGTGIGAVLRPMAPILLGYSAVQINTALDSQIAWWLSPDGHNGAHVFQVLGHNVHVAMEAGAVAKLSMAQRVYLLPVGIFGVAMALAAFGPMAAAAAKNNMEELKRVLVVGLKKTLFLSIPSSFGMILVARPLLTIVYLGGHTTAEDIERAYWASIFFCVGIWAFEAQMMILRVFFVLKDTVTPTLVAVGMVVLNFALNVTLVWWLREGGIALATTVAAVVQGAILLLILRRRLGRLGIRGLGLNVAKGCLATAVMVGVGLALNLVPMPWEGGGGGVIGLREKLLTACVKLPALVAVCGTVYLGLARMMKMPELADVPVVGRYFRRGGV